MEPWKTCQWEVHSWECFGLYALTTFLIFKLLTSSNSKLFIILSVSIIPLWAGLFLYHFFIWFFSGLTFLSRYFPRWRLSPSNCTLMSWQFEFRCFFHWSIPEWITMGLLSCRHYESLRLTLLLGLSFISDEMFGRRLLYFNWWWSLLTCCCFDTWNSNQLLLRLLFRCLFSWVTLLFFFFLLLNLDRLSWLKLEF